MFQRLLLLTIAIFSLAACNRDNVSLQRNPQGGVDITVNASESDVNTVISNALAKTANPLVRNPSIDLQNGQIVISGEHDKRDGSGQRVSGTITLVLSVENGALKAQVTAVNIEGYTADDQRIAEINQRIEQALQGRALRDNPNVNLTAISVTDNDLTFTLNATRS